MKSANSRSSSRARSGSVRTNEAIAASELKMKCGEIWARSARISASISRARDCVEFGQFQLDGDPPGDLLGGPDQHHRLVRARRRPGRRAPGPSTTSGATTAQRTGQSGVVAGEPGRSPPGRCRAHGGRVPSPRPGGARRRPSQASGSAASVRHSAAGAEQRSQPADRLAGALLGQPRRATGRRRARRCAGCGRWRAPPRCRAVARCGGLPPASARSKTTAHGRTDGARRRHTAHAVVTAAPPAWRGLRGAPRGRQRPRVPPAGAAGPWMAAVPAGTAALGGERDQRPWRGSRAAPSRAAGPRHQGVRPAAPRPAGDGRGDGGQRQRRRRPASRRSRPAGSAGATRCRAPAAGRRRRRPPRRPDRPRRPPAGRADRQGERERHAIAASSAERGTCRTPRRRAARPGCSTPATAWSARRRSTGTRRTPRRPAARRAVRRRAPPIMRAGSSRTAASVSPGERQVGRVEPPERAVERRQQVEGADQAEDDDGGAAGGAGRAGWCRSGPRRAAGPSCRGTCARISAVRRVQRMRFLAAAGERPGPAGDVGLPRSTGGGRHRRPGRERAAGAVGRCRWRPAVRSHLGPCTVRPSTVPVTVTVDGRGRR